MGLLVRTAETNAFITTNITNGLTDRYLGARLLKEVVNFENNDIFILYRFLKHKAYMGLSTLALVMQLDVIGAAIMTWGNILFIPKCMTKGVWCLV